MLSETAAGLRDVPKHVLNSVCAAGETKHSADQTSRRPADSYLPAQQSIDRKADQHHRDQEAECEGAAYPPVTMIA